MENLVNDLTDKINNVILISDKSTTTKNIKNILTTTLEKFNIVAKDDLVAQKQLLTKLINKVSVLESKL